MNNVITNHSMAKDGGGCCTLYSHDCCAGGGACMTLKIETIDRLCEAFDRYNEYLFKTGISQFPDFYLSQYVTNTEVFNEIAAVTGRPIEDGKYHTNDGKSSRTFTYNGVEFLHYE